MKLRGLRINDKFIIDNDAEWVLDQNATKVKQIDQNFFRNLKVVKELQDRVKEEFANQDFMNSGRKKQTRVIKIRDQLSDQFEGSSADEEEENNSEEAEENRELLEGLDLANKSLNIDDGKKSVSYATAYLQGYENDNEFGMLAKQPKKSQGKNFSELTGESSKNGLVKKIDGSNGGKIVKKKLMKLIKNSQNEWEWVEDDLFNQGEEDEESDEEKNALLQDYEKTVNSGPQESFSRAFKKVDDNDQAWTMMVSYQTLFLNIQKRQKEHRRQEILVKKQQRTDRIRRMQEDKKRTVAEKEYHLNEYVRMSNEIYR